MAAREFSVKAVEKKSVTLSPLDGGKDVTLPCTTPAALDHYRACKDSGKTVALDA